MGLFDSVYVSEELAASWLRCPQCGQAPAKTVEWQTKSLSPGLVSYLLRHDANGLVRLYLLDRPSDQRFWRAWSNEEIAESERAPSGSLGWLLRKKSGEGYFLPEAFQPENRRQRFMGELPHQWVEIHSQCGCGGDREMWLKFTDGVAVEVRPEAPSHEAGFFDDASGWD
jgi:hypothetical protein